MTTTSRRQLPLDAERCELIHPATVTDVAGIGILAAKYRRCPRVATHIAKHRRMPRQYRCCQRCARELERKDFTATELATRGAG